MDHVFKDYVVDQLSGVENLLSKRMFGGFGLYCGETFFGIISDDRLYFKTTPETRDRYTEAEMGPFQPSRKVFGIKMEAVLDAEEGGQGVWIAGLSTALANAVQRQNSPTHWANATPPYTEYFPRVVLLTKLRIRCNIAG